MQTTKPLLAYSVNNTFEVHPTTSKSKILHSITPVLYPDNAVPKEIMKVNLPGLDDIAICFTYPIPGTEYASITHTLCSLYKITAKDLMQSLDNTPEKYRLQTMEEMLGLPGTGCPMYILTNENTIFGAAGIIVPKICKYILERFHGTGFYMLPSSIHEVILIPEDQIEGPEQALIDMVQHANQTVVDESDYLSDHVYKINADLSFQTIRSKN